MYAFLAVIAGLSAGILGSVLYYRQRSRSAQHSIETAHEKAKKLLEEAESKERDVLVRAKDKAIKILEEARIEEKKLREDLNAQQKKLSDREEEFSSKILEADNQRKQLEQRAEDLAKQTEEIQELKAEERKKLEEVANLTEQQAVDRMLKLIEEQHEDTLLSRVRKLEQMESDEIERKARNILAVSMQRIAASQAIETTTTHVELPGDEMKGRIIGREGRNIKSIELLTGCELIIDDTPNMITVSGFSPIRRQVAKRALDKLIHDGRIHPGRIEESIEEAKKELVLDIKKAGEDALYQLGISMAGIDPKLLQILGRLKYRTSYGQNALQHSVEVAMIATAIGEELGADTNVCKKGGLFHDIGKAVDHDMQGGHPELGVQILKKFGFPEEIWYQSIGHHEDRPKTLEAVIIKAADAISGTRPGARKDSLEQYVKRLGELEAVANSFDGIEKCYAIQAGREIRVFVNPKMMDDFATTNLAREVAAKIESELRYPGEVRVTVIRETRVIEYAR